MLRLYLLPLVFYVLTIRVKSLNASIKTENKDRIKVDVVLLLVISLLSILLILNESIFT